jgi:hypothetical protein
MSGFVRDGPAGPGGSMHTYAARWGTSGGQSRRPIVLELVGLETAGNRQNSSVSGCLQRSANRRTLAPPAIRQ